MLERPDYKIIDIPMVKLHRAWNWVAFGHLCGDFDERTARAFATTDDGMHIMPTYRVPRPAESHRVAYPRISYESQADSSVKSLVFLGVVLVYPTQHRQNSSPFLLANPPRQRTADKAVDRSAACLRCP